MEGICWYCKKVGHPWFKCFSRPEGWAPPGMKPPSGERAQGGAVQDSAAMAAAAKATAGGDATAPTDGVLEAVKKVQKQQTHGEQNGVAERFNRTLQEGARTLLGRAGLPDPFWVSALSQVALVKNRVLATVGDKEWIPYVKWYGSAPAVNMLRAFGCMVVFHVPKEKRGKLEASGRWGAHLGIAKDHKGWLLWDLTTQKLTVSRDVKFFESLYYKEWKQQQQKLPSTPLIEKDEILMLLVYVDDILLFSASTALLDSAEQMLEMQFKCSKMGEVKYYLGMHVERDLEAAKRLVRYVSTTASVGLEYSGVRQRLQRGAADVKIGEMLLSCYTDASFNSVKADGTSIGGYVCLPGGGAYACLHGLTKHIRPKWHWVRRLLDKEVRLEIVKTHQQAADIFTKHLAEADHWKGMKLAGTSVH
ncbi:hypothetical protein CLOP_g922 [Closterium sp. NIES-67]|nr:hypothetical protein CLOP_g922 [Closterium sp. NIES-67]